MVRATVFYLGAGLDTTRLCPYLVIISDWLRTEYLLTVGAGSGLSSLLLETLVIDCPLWLFFQKVLAQSQKPEIET